jgi:HEPN domain-containing protein/predicted nucleotidyltransferase
MKTSLPQRSEHVAEQLAAIANVIRELVGDDLAMLILFGSYARGDWVNDRYVEGDIIYTYQSDFDLLLVSEHRSHATVDGEFRLCDAIGRRLRRLGLDRPSATIIVEDIEHLNKDLQRGNYFYADIKKEGVLLFDNGRHTLAEAVPLDPVESQKHVRDDFEHWFTSACQFYAQSQNAVSEGWNNNAAFQLHQATERFLNAIVLTFTRYKPKTHDIERLDRQASNLHADFFTVFPRASEQQKRCFDLLKKAYIDARYKRDYAITNDELEYLAGRVRRLQELTKRICEEKIAGIA